MARFCFCKFQKISLYGSKNSVLLLCVVVFMVRSESIQIRSQRKLASLNCSERAKFEDDSAVSLPVAVRNRYILIFILESRHRHNSP